MINEYSLYFQELPTFGEFAHDEHPSDLPHSQNRLHSDTSSHPGHILQSNNPFLRVAPSSPAPSAGNEGDTTEDDDDEQLRKALLRANKIEVDDNRQEREKSERAVGAPPPSPVGGDGTMTGTLFGPSEKTDEDGKMALVPSGLVKPVMSSAKIKLVDDRL